MVWSYIPNLRSFSSPPWALTSRAFICPRAQFNPSQNTWTPLPLSPGLLTSRMHGRGSALSPKWPTMAGSPTSWPHSDHCSVQRQHLIGPQSLKQRSSTLEQPLCSRLGTEWRSLTRNWKLFSHLTGPSRASGTGYVKNIVNVIPSYLVPARQAGEWHSQARVSCVTQNSVTLPLRVRPWLWHGPWITQRFLPLDAKTW